MNTRTLFTLILIIPGIISCEKDIFLGQDINSGLQGESEYLYFGYSSEDLKICGEIQSLKLSEETEEGKTDYVQVNLYNDNDFLYMHFTLLDNNYNIESTTVKVGDSEFKGENSIYKFNLADFGDCIDIELGATLNSVEPVEFVFSHLQGLSESLTDTSGLPGTVSMTVDYFGTTDSYFNTSIDDDNFGLEGDWEGWCVDLGRSIASGVVYDSVRVYSSYDDTATLARIIDKPENLAKVNYILSRGFVGSEAACGDIFSRSDVQRAIWALTDNEGTFHPEDGPLVLGGGLIASQMSLCKVQEILDAAESFGRDYIPECLEAGDGTFTYKVAVILDPNTTSVTGQVTIGQVTVVDLIQPCELIPVYGSLVLSDSIIYHIQECPVIDDPIECEIVPGAFRTQSMGGWGAPAAGNNPGAYRNANFDKAFPGGLVVGSKYTITLTSADAVRRFLPQGGRPSTLRSDLVDPVKSIGNFAGQVVALKLSVGFDLADPDFGSSQTNLRDLVFASGPFAGMSVGEVLEEAERLLGGEKGKFSLQQLNAAITSVNENFVDGDRVVNRRLLNCGY